MYRQQLDQHIYTAEEAFEWNESSYLLETEVKGILDNIEARVNDIKDILDSIYGLTEVNEAKELIKALSKDLY